MFKEAGLINTVYAAGPGLNGTGNGPNFVVNFNFSMEAQ
jgi:hypothetical protein